MTNLPHLNAINSNTPLPSIRMNVLIYKHIYHSTGGELFIYLQLLSRDTPLASSHFYEFDFAVR